MSECPECHNQFVQPFVCTTCGAAKLYDATVTSLQARNDALRARVAECEGALADIAFSDEMSLQVAKSKARRVYNARATESAGEGLSGARLGNAMPAAAGVAGCNAETGGESRSHPLGDAESAPAAPDRTVPRQSASRGEE
jgi:hypothetical protein